MADTQDVIIVGVEGGVSEWSTESTQKSIEGSIKQTTAQNTAIIALLRLVAKGESASKDQLNAIKVEIAQQSKNNAKDKQVNKASEQASAQQSGKNNSLLNSMLDLYKINTNQLKTNDKNAAQRQIKLEKLMSMGESKESATATLRQEEKINRVNDIGKAAGKAAISFGVLGKGAIDTIMAAVDTGFTERFDMASDMRQSGLFAGIDEAKQGFISIAETISATGFTFGEAAEFTKRFSKAVGVTGVKSALDFATSVADVGNTEGMMQRFSMDFGQIANMSGQYLESLRVAGQLQNRDKQDLKSGMESFMSNVQMTSNVLKISMEEAAELMQKSVSPDQAGLLATLPKEMRMQVEDAMKAMNVQGGPMGEALAARLAAGSQQAFLQTDEYQNLAGTGVGQELLGFINQISGSIESGSNEDFQAMMAEEFPKFAESLQGFASQDGVRVQLLGNKQLAALVGQLLESAQTYGKSDTGVSRGGKEDTTRMLATEQTRKASVLAEQSMNKLMPAFTDNLIKLTATNEAFALEAAKALVHYQDAISLAVDVSTGIQRLQTGTGTIILDIINGKAEGHIENGYQDNGAYMPLNDDELMHNEAASYYNQLIPTSKKELTPLAQQSTTLAAQQAQFATGFSGDVADQKEFLESLLARVEKMNQMQISVENHNKEPAWRTELGENMKATELLITQMRILNDQLIQK